MILFVQRVDEFHLLFFVLGGRTGSRGHGVTRYRADLCYPVETRVGTRERWKISNADKQSRQQLVILVNHLSEWWVWNIFLTCVFIPEQFDTYYSNP